jgi:thioredoxin-related protein
MKKLFIIAVLVALSIGLKAQDTHVIKLTDTAKLYNPKADAKEEIADAVKQAAKEHKNVLLQIGGNWCIWCIRFNDLVYKTTELNSYVRNNYVVVHVNYSPENRNEKILADLGYPQRFGFPVFVILDAKGKYLHTENSSYLEEGSGHSPKKVLEFFKDWSPMAIDPKTYGKSK